jgi:hypothetical protein
MFANAALEASFNVPDPEIAQHSEILPKYV